MPKTNYILVSYGSEQHNTHHLPFMQTLFPIYSLFLVAANLKTLEAVTKFHIKDLSSMVQHLPSMSGLGNSTVYMIDL